MAHNPTPLPGSGGRTDSLTFIPTLEDKRQPERKDKDDSESTHSTHSKKGWGWFKGGDEKKDKGKKKHEEEHKKGKYKIGDKGHESARLDVLQATMEPSKSRESLLLERESPGEDRRKDGHRKASDTRKEKDGLFSSLFGGKKKGDKYGNDKKANSLSAQSPEPPHRQLRPDIDYNWTRFSILEERAIYRMAHIKLANPRRALSSQVLLSNFMYSYLAKVQQMHPHMQIPQSMAQKRAEAEKRQQELLAQQRKQQELQSEQYQFDYNKVSVRHDMVSASTHRKQGISQYAESSDQAGGGAHYVDDSQIYSSDHNGGSNNRTRLQPGYPARGDYNQNHQYSQDDEKGYYYGDQQGDDDDDDDDDMW